MSGDCLESIICSIPCLCCIVTPVLLLRLIELVLGGLSTIISGVVAGCYIWFLTEFGPHYLSNDDFQQKLDSLANLRNFDSGSFPAEYNSRDYGNAVDASFAVSVIGAMIYSTHFFDSILLIVGRQLEIPKLLLPWMFMTIISIMWSLIAVMVDLILAPQQPRKAYNWIEIGCYLAAIPLQIICFLLIKNQYSQMTKTPENRDEEMEVKDELL